MAGEDSPGKIEVGGGGRGNKLQKERYEDMGEGWAVKAATGTLVWMELKENQKPFTECFN